MQLTRSLHKRLFLGSLQLLINFVQHVFYSEFPKLTVSHQLSENFLIPFHAVDD